MELKKENIFIEVLNGELKKLSIDGNPILNQDFKSWSKTFPVLFPVIGNSVSYSYNNKKYKIGRHGFWNKLEWTGYKTEDSIEMQAVVIEDEKYPFSFDLSIQFKIIENGLEVNITITNVSKRVQYFHFGLHPSFAIDETSRIIFKDKELFSKVNFDKSLMGGKFDVNNKIANIPFGEEFDTLLLTNVNSKVVTIVNKTYSLDLKFDSKDLAIWKPRGAQFICVEPWDGASDNIYDNPPEVCKKKDVTILGSCKTLKRSFIIKYSSNNASK